MTELRPNMMMSLDGLVAGPGRAQRARSGSAGCGPTKWLVPLKAVREMPGEEAGEVTAGTPIVEGWTDHSGATVRYRNMFGGGPGPWGADPWNG